MLTLAADRSNQKGSLGRSQEIALPLNSKAPRSA